MNTEDLVEAWAELQAADQRDTLVVNARTITESLEEKAENWDIWRLIGEVFYVRTDPSPPLGVLYVINRDHFTPRPDEPLFDWED